MTDRPSVKHRKVVIDMQVKAKTTKVKYLLKLYVNKGKVSVRTIESLKKALRGTNYKIVIIDIEKQPEEAEKDNVLVVPTLIKELPPPLRRIVGELVNDNKEKVFTGLDIVKEI